MSKRKLTDAQVEKLMEDYYSWEKYNPESETAEELAARHGISKQTLYKEKRDYERRRGMTMRPPLQVVGDGSSPTAGAGLEDVVRFLTAELIAAKLQIKDLEEGLVVADRERAELRSRLSDVEKRHVGL